MHQPQRIEEGPLTVARCVATSRTQGGDRCKNPAVPGATVCRFHGGATQHVRKKAALRLAALELYLDSAPALPFIADDLFVNYDDDRSLAGLQQLAEVSRRTQVIFLTHHEHMAELAREGLAGKARIIELSGVA